MNDAGLSYALNQLLGKPTHNDATTFVEQSVGEDYRPVLNRVLARLSFKRTLSQNALLHQWFGQIAKHHGDMTPHQVKGMCHERWALSIRLRDEGFAWIWEKTGARMNYDQQCNLLASSVYQISSAMSTKELAEYMNEIDAHYRPLGVPLTAPSK